MGLRERTEGFFFRLWSKALQFLYLIIHLVQNFSNLLYKTRDAKLTIQFKI